MEKEETEGRLFKYIKINNYTRNNLLNNELFFNNPEYFNDPFDSKIEVEFKGTIKDWYYWASLRKNIDKKVIDKWREDEILIEVGNGIFEINPTKNDKILKDVTKFRYKICCFSKTKLSILMWSHYADSHKGICLCFKTHILENHHLLELPLSYSMSMSVGTIPKFSDF